MRFLTTLLNDIRFQIKYGFYFLYVFISMIYIGALLFCPVGIRTKVAVVIILSDPAMLGMFFIGGIWLLEKGEGLHYFWSISPLRSLEYVLSKVISLSLISALSAMMITFVGFGKSVNIIGIGIYVFLGSMVFTTIGLWLGTYARSVNRYLLIASLPSTLLITPAILDVFGISYSILNVLPGTALGRSISHYFGLVNISMLPIVFTLAGWLALTLYLTCIRVPIAFKEESGEKL